MQLQELIPRKHSGLASCLASLDRELQLLEGLKPMEEASMEFIEAMRAAVDRLVGEADRFAVLGGVWEGTKAHIQVLKGSGSRCAGAMQQLADTEEAEVSELLSAVNTDAVTSAIEKAKDHVGAQYVPRLVALRAKKVELLEEGTFMAETFECALKAGERVIAVKEQVSAAQKVLQRSKKDLVSPQPRNRMRVRTLQKQRV